MMGRLWALPAVCLLLPACGDGNGDDDAGGGGASVLASARIGPAGGTVEVLDPASPYEGTRIVLPSGALAQNTLITIEAVEGMLPPEILQVRIGPAGADLAAPALVRIKYSDDYPEDFLLPDSPMVPVSFQEPPGAEVYERTGQDFVRNLVEFQTTRLGRFTALLEPGFADHYRFLVQDRMLAVEALTRPVGGETVVVSGARPGASPVTVGKGGGDAAWSSSSVLILVHSTSDQATQFVGPDDLIAGLSGAYDHILTYQYRSGRPIAENANWLYNEIKRRAQPGFRADLLGYSMGGVVVRYAVEAAQGDPARADLPNFDAAASNGPMSALIRNVFTLGSPNAGAVPAALSELLGVASLLDFDVATAYFPGPRDIADGAEGVPARLNAAYVDDPEIRYFLVAGASNDSALSPLIPGDDDGLVSVASALGVPVLNPPEQGLVFPPAGEPGFVYNHSNLHAEAVPNGIRDQILAWKGL